MPGLFGGDSNFSSTYSQQGSDKGNQGFRRAQGVINRATLSNNLLFKHANNAVPAPFAGSLTTPGLTANIGPGGVSLTQSDAVKAYMDALSNGMNTDETGYTSLLGQLHPGFGQVTAARRAALDAAQQKAVGDLGSQLQKRRIAGSSFANNQISDVNAEFGKQKAEADAQSFLDELKATQDLMTQRTSARMGAIQTALSQSNFESDLGSKLLQSSMQNATDLAKIHADLATAHAQLNMAGATTLANVAGGISQTQIGTYPQYAGIDAQEAAGGGNALGSILGTVLGGLAGNPAIGGAIGNAVFGKPTTATA